MHLDYCLRLFPHVGLADHPVLRPNDGWLSVHEGFDGVVVSLRRYEKMILILTLDGEQRAGESPASSPLPRKETQLLIW